MSTILDALRKAQAGREVDDEPPPQDRAQPAPPVVRAETPPSSAAASTNDELEFEAPTPMRAEPVGWRRNRIIPAVGVVAAGLVLGLFVSHVARQRLAPFIGGPQKVEIAGQRAAPAPAGHEAKVPQGSKSVKNGAVAAGVSEDAGAGNSRRRGRDSHARAKPTEPALETPMPTADAAAQPAEPLPASPMQPALLQAPAPQGPAANAGQPVAAMGQPLPAQTTAPSGLAPGVAPSSQPPIVTAAATAPSAGPGEPLPGGVPESTGTVLEAPPAGSPEVSLLFIKWSRDVERRVASLRGPGGKLLLVHEGDLVEGMRVAAIRADAVELQWRGTNFLLLAAR